MRFLDIDIEHACGTIPLCVAYCADAPEIALPGKDGIIPCPRVVRDAVADDDCYFVAWYAKHEYEFIRDHLPHWPQKPRNRYLDAMVLAVQNGYPRKLSSCARVLKGEQKDMAGHAVMLRLTKMASGWSKEDLELLYAYCIQDVVVERQIFRRFLKMLYPEGSTERQIELLDVKINDTGFAIDVGLARACQTVVQRLKPLFDAKIVELTGGEVNTVGQTAALKEFLAKRGHVFEKLNRKSIEEYLEDPEADEIRELLLTRLEGNRMAASKAKAALKNVSPDGRLRDAFSYYGASATGRWSGSKFQPQNLMKAGSEDIVTLILEILSYGGAV
jgi:DNA polymerase bacteriophage-type